MISLYNNIFTLPPYCMRGSNPPHLSFTAEMTNSKLRKVRLHHWLCTICSVYWPIAELISPTDSALGKSPPGSLSSNDTLVSWTFAGGTATSSRDSSGMAAGDHTGAVFVPFTSLYPPSWQRPGVAGLLGTAGALAEAEKKAPTDRCQAGGASAGTSAAAASASAAMAVGAGAVGFGGEAAAATAACKPKRSTTSGFRSHTYTVGVTATAAAPASSSLASAAAAAAGTSLARREARSLTALRHSRRVTSGCSRRKRCATRSSAQVRMGPARPSASARSSGSSSAPRHAKGSPSGRPSRRKSATSTKYTCPQPSAPLPAAASFTKCSAIVTPASFLETAGYSAQSAATASSFLIAWPFRIFTKKRSISSSSSAVRFFAALPPEGLSGHGRLRPGEAPGPAP
mmetsp:Transcript_26443/g.46143  ORF Transcript_26443/g.46143 Transcript_26443/m.46143 type:complete len:400 (-) Transcript_26443:42-1241(-)